MFISFFSMLLLIGFIQTGPLQPSEKEIVRILTNETRITTGKKNFILIQVKVKDGYHIQANKVTDASLIPLTLKVVPHPSFQIASPFFPAYKLFRLEGTRDYLHVFDSVFVISLPVKTRAATKAGQYLIKAQLRYQACDARSCLFPRTLNIDLPVVCATK